MWMLYVVSLQDRLKDGRTNHIYFLHAPPINQPTNVNKIIKSYLAEMELTSNWLILSNCQSFGKQH